MRILCLIRRRVSGAHDRREASGGVKPQSEVINTVLEGIPCLPHGSADKGGADATKRQCVSPMYGMWQLWKEIWAMNGAPARPLECTQR